MTQEEFEKKLDEKNIDPELKKNFLELFSVSNEEGKKFLLERISEL